MSVLIAIDKILEIQFVRWGLLLVCAGLFVAGGVQTTRLWYQGIEIRGMKGEIAANEKLQEALHAAGERQEARAKAAFREAALMRAKTEQMGRDARGLVHHEDCSGALDDATRVLETLP